MVATTGAYSGMTVSDLDEAARFYVDTLGLDVDHTPNGLSVRAHGHTVFVYPKPDHQPATYTALYLEVADIDDAVDTLAAAGVQFARYEGMRQDDKGIARGRAAGRGPDIAWFTDPAGNIIAILNG